MKIVTKLTLAFLSISLLFLAVGYIATSTSQNALVQSIGNSSVFLAKEVLDKMDRAVYNKIIEIKSYSRE